MKLFPQTVIIAVVLSGFAYAGGTSIKKTLLASFEDGEVRAQEENTGLQKGSYGGIPYIDDVELRFRNEAFDINRFRYSLRIQPRGFGETRAASGYNELFSESYKRKLQLVRNRALRDRYVQILDMMEQRTAEEHYKELILVYEDRIKVLEKKKFDINEFDLNEIIDGEDKNTTTHTQLFELKRTFFPARNVVGNSLHDTAVADFDTTGFVNVDSVIALVMRQNFSFDTNNVYMEYFRLQHQIERARYNLEKAEQRKYVSFLGFSYDNGDMLDEIIRRDNGKTFNFNNSYALELGIRIPDLTVARHDLARRQANYLSEKEDYEQAKRELAAQMEKDKEDLLSFIAQYRFLAARENEVDATSSLKKYLQMSGVDPLVLLSIQESIIKNHIEIAKLKFSILRNYIQVIDVAGELSKPPLRNFLSKNLEVME